MISRRSLTRPGMLRLVILIAGSLLVIAAGASYLLTRGPLAGSRRHDFGDVTVQGASVELNHTFRLTNRTGRALTIRRVVPSCGCAAATVSANEIAPGKAVEIAVVFHLAMFGQEHSNIALDLGDDGVTTLTVRATRRRPAAAR